MADMDSLPVYISDSERIARAVFHPYHFNKKGKLRGSAFKAPAGRRDVSANRLLALNETACKQKAKLINNPGNFYGFAVIGAGIVRDVGSDVIDSRDQYFGHADIIHDVVLEKDQAAPPEFNHRLKKLAEKAVYFPDPNPDSNSWEGESFCQESA